MSGSTFYESLGPGTGCPSKTTFSLETSSVTSRLRNPQFDPFSFLRELSEFRPPTR